ncbi:MAG: cysteine--tRNA ligase [Chitinivibrionales bacterium]
MADTLHLYNTATRQKEKFEPMHDVVGLYCCGPTVYNYAHIGNLRTYVWEDVLKRTLLSLGYPVRHVTNITDVGHLTSDEDTGEDKMETGARREGKTVWDIAEHFTQSFRRDIAALNISEPDVWPRATGHIKEMIQMVQTLEQKGYTYQTSDGIYFDTTRFHRYTDFARLDPDTLRAGSRIDMGEKKHPTDFAVWKHSPREVRRAMEWDSPWGRGFPGWHIECSVMALKYLPQPIDIHCGGQEHIRVHHTNEIAQAEAATGKQFVRFWLHGEWLTLDSGKMAKSGGNSITLERLQEEGIDPLAYRLFTFSAHYRTPLTFSWEGIRSAQKSLDNLRALISGEIADASEVQDQKREREILGSFYAALYDDLNTSRALAALYDVLRKTTLSALEKRMAVVRADEILALDLLKQLPVETVEEFRFDDGTTVVVVGGADQFSKDQARQVARKVYERRIARKNKDFQSADAIRDELKSRGVEVRDLPDGITECRL